MQLTPDAPVFYGAGPRTGAPTPAPTPPSHGVVVDVDVHASFVAKVDLGFAGVVKKGATPSSVANFPHWTANLTWGAEWSLRHQRKAPYFHLGGIYFDIGTLIAHFLRFLTDKFDRVTKRKCTV